MIRETMKQVSITTFARAQSRARLTRLLKELRRAGKHPEDPETIHDLRVSIRRFTQGLRTFRSVFDPGPLKKLQRRLRKLMDAGGSVRTCDVALDVLRQAGVENGLSTSRIAAARTEAEETLRDRLKKQRRRKASDWELKLDIVVKPDVAQPDVDQPGCEWDLQQDMPDNLRRVLPKMAEDFFAAGSAAAAAGDDHEILHRFRLRTKHFRYTLELFPTFYHNQLPQGLKALQGLQDRLGEINDCVCTMALIGKDRRAMAAVRKLLRQREAEFRAYWKKAFPRTKLAWWRKWLGAPRFPA